MHIKINVKCEVHRNLRRQQGIVRASSKVRERPKERQRKSKKVSQKWSPGWFPKTTARVQMWKCFVVPTCFFGKSRTCLLWSHTGPGKDSGRTLARNSARRHLSGPKMLYWRKWTDWWLFALCQSKHTKRLEKGTPFLTAIIMRSQMCVWERVRHESSKDAYLSALWIVNMLQLLREQIFQKLAPHDDLFSVDINKVRVEILSRTILNCANNFFLNQLRSDFLEIVSNRNTRQAFSGI